MYYVVFSSGSSWSLCAINVHWGMLWSCSWSWCGATSFVREGITFLPRPSLSFYLQPVLLSPFLSTPPPPLPSFPSPLLPPPLPVPSPSTLPPPLPLNYPPLPLYPSPLSLPCWCSCTCTLYHQYVSGVWLF